MEAGYVRGEEMIVWVSVLTKSSLVFVKDKRLMNRGYWVILKKGGTWLLLVFSSANTLEWMLRHAEEHVWEEGGGWLS